jgi:hypothetical protein
MDDGMVTLESKARAEAVERMRAAIAAEAVRRITMFLPVFVIVDTMDRPGDHIHLKMNRFDSPIGEGDIPSSRQEAMSAPASPGVIRSVTTGRTRSACSCKRSSADSHNGRAIGQAAAGID